MIQSVQRAMRLLSILGDAYNRPVSLATLSERAGLNKSTCAHLISTLEAEGYAVKISHSKGYVLGPAAYCLSRFGRYKTELVSVCRPVMQYLNRQLGHTVILAVIEANNKYIIDSIDDGELFEQKARIRVGDIYRTATGRAILANLDTEQLRDIFQKIGPPKPQDWPEVASFEQMLEQLSRADPRAVFCTHTVRGQDLSIGYGAAVFDARGCCGAIGVAVNAVVSADEEKQIKTLLERAAREATRRLQAGSVKRMI